MSISSSVRTLLLATLIAGTAPACGNGGDDPEARATPCPTPVPAPAARARLLPRRLHLDRFGTVTRVVERRGALGAEIVSGSTVIELYPPLARALLGARYEITSGENEGFEAEIFFARKNEAGAFRLREGPCDGQVTIKALFGIDRGRP